jgi:hypothetical protein
MLHPALRRLGAIALLTACTGCPGGLQDPSRFDLQASNAGCPDVPQSLFLPTCATSACHSADAKMEGLDLQSPNVAARLIGAHAMGGPGFLIDPSTPAASVIYTKLTATPPFGVRMPFSEPALDEATIGCVLQWLTEQVDGGAGEGGTGEVDASASDGTTSDDGSSTASDDGSPFDDGSLGGEDADSPDAAAPIIDAGSTPDAHMTHPRDASAPEAGAPEAGAAPDSG